jgi:chaperonin cofactor prefoldin
VPNKDSPRLERWGHPVTLDRKVDAHQASQFHWGVTLDQPLVPVTRKGCDTHCFSLWLRKQPLDPLMRKLRVFFFACSQQSEVDMQVNKPEVDWEIIEKHYRAGVMTLRQIASEGGVVESAVRKRAKRDGWPRNLNAKIQARAEDLVRKDAVRKISAQKNAPSEKEVVEVNAQAAAIVLIVQKDSIKRSHTLFKKLMDELELTTDNKDLFGKLGELLDKSGPDENGKMVQDKINEIYRKVISMPGRVDAAKKMTEILEKVVKLEREAFGLDDGNATDNPVDALLRKIYKERISGN